MATCNVQTLLANAACFECLSPGMWEIIELQLLCEILAVGGGGGGGGGGVNNFAVAGPPTTQVPANNAGTYYDYTNKILYNWNPTTPGWE